MDDLTETITCSICIGLFEEPVLIPCQHSFCRACLKDYINTNRNNNPRQNLKYKCPLCRHVHVLKNGNEDVANYPIHRVLVTLLDNRDVIYKGMEVKNMTVKEKSTQTENDSDEDSETEVKAEVTFLKKILNPINLQTGKDQLKKEAIEPKAKRRKRSKKLGEIKVHHDENIDSGRPDVGLSGACIRYLLMPNRTKRDQPTGRSVFWARNITTVLVFVLFLTYYVYYMYQGIKIIFEAFRLKSFQHVFIGVHYVCFLAATLEDMYHRYKYFGYAIHITGETFHVDIKATMQLHILCSCIQGCLWQGLIMLELTIPEALAAMWNKLPVVLDILNSKMEMTVGYVIIFDLCVISILIILTIEITEEYIASLNTPVETRQNAQA